MTNPLMVIWAAFASSQLLLAGVAWVVWPGPDPAAATLAWALAGVGLLTGASSLVLPQALLRGDGEEGVRTRYLVRWALAESATVMGLVGTLLGGPQWLALAAAAWAFVLLFLAIPRA